MSEVKLLGHPKANGTVSLRDIATVAFKKTDEIIETVDIAMADIEAAINNRWNPFVNYYVNYSLDMDEAYQYENEETPLLTANVTKSILFGTFEEEPLDFLSMFSVHDTYYLMSSKNEFNQTKFRSAKRIANRLSAYLAENYVNPGMYDPIGNLFVDLNYEEQKIMVSSTDFSSKERIGFRATTEDLKVDYPNWQINFFSSSPVLHAFLNNADTYLDKTKALNRDVPIGILEEIGGSHEKCKIIQFVPRNRQNNKAEQ